MTTPILSIGRLTKRFDNQDAVYDIDLKINPSEIIAVKGRPGSGKTTLLKLSAGLIPPTSGDILLNGEPLAYGNKEMQNRIGLFLHEYGVYERLTVRKYLEYFRKLYNIPDSRVDEVIALAGLIDRKDMKLSKASANFLARVELARTMLHKPILLLLDEPSTQLDIETMQILRHMIVSAAEDGAAVLLATNSYEEAMTLASRTAILNKGRIERWESAAETKPESNEMQLSGIYNENGAGNHVDSTHIQSLGSQIPSEIPVSSSLKFEKVPARVNDRIILFNPLELIYIESQEGQSLLHTADESLPCPLTLTELEEKLKPFGFYRSHRSYIVNLQHVREVIPWTRNSYSLVLDDEQKTSIPLSKNSIKELEGIIGM